MSNRAGETVVPKTEKLNLETGKTERIYSRGESQGMIRTKFQRKLIELPFSLFILLVILENPELEVSCHMVLLVCRKYSVPLILLQRLLYIF